MLADPKLDRNEYFYGQLQSAREFWLAPFIASKIVGKSADGVFPRSSSSSSRTLLAADSVSNALSLVRLDSFAILWAVAIWL
jgi:hypothetical protein